MKLKSKLKIEEFLLFELWQYILIIAIVSLFAWLFNKPYETIMFCIAHLVLRPVFYKQYHCGTVYACTFLTLTIAFLGIYTTLPVSVSLLSSIPVACFVCLVGYIAQDRIDMKKRTVDNLTRDELSEIINNSLFSNEERFILDFYLLQGMRGEELYKAMGYSKRQCIRIYKKAKTKLNKYVTNMTPRI